MATLQKFKHLATKCTVAPSPTRSPSSSPVIHLRRRKTLRMLLSRTGNRRLTTHDEFTDRKGDSPENRKDCGVRRKLKDLLVASPENRRLIDVDDSGDGGGRGGGLVMRRRGGGSWRPLTGTLRQRLLLRRAWRPVLVTIPE
ncbi:hypothetical protein Tco_0020769 [Tanacetum coccineum]